MNSTTITTAIILATIFITSAEEEHHKRVPSGFTGVRGKKSIPEPAYSTGSPTTDSASELKAVYLVSDMSTDEKRAASGFMGVKGKKPFLTWEETYPNRINKRTPSGFRGMREKKDVEGTPYGEYFKRAPSGFMGMRGKKGCEDLSNQCNSYFDKKFLKDLMRMRGKENYDDIVKSKRAPSGFFGVRGKKMPGQSGFFGMRGKKYPYEFRGKFVGVRGKKANNDLNFNYLNNRNTDLNSLGQDLDINQFMLLLTENVDSENIDWDESQKFDQNSQE